MALFQTETLGPGALMLRGFVLSRAAAVLEAIEMVQAAAPLRHMCTPGGQRMSVAMSNCGALGWVTDRRGYRYVAEDPLSGRPWPPMPALLHDLARSAAAAAGFDGFDPDACLINRYGPGARMSLHQDRDEADLSQPIVSVSLGMGAVFQFGGLTRATAAARLILEHGDVVVWGGEDRLRYHGVMPLRGPAHPQLGAQRLNLTFRRAR